MVVETKRTRLTVDLSVELKRRLRLVAAQRDVSLREYVLLAVEERLNEDWTEIAAANATVALTAEADPVLAELWDNPEDAAYDRL